MNNLHAISLITQYGLVAQGLEHHTGVMGSWVQSPAGSLLSIHLCDWVWNLVNSYIIAATLGNEIKKYGCKARQVWPWGGVLEYTRQILSLGEQPLCYKLDNLIWTGSSGVRAPYQGNGVLGSIPSQFITFGASMWLSVESSQFLHVGYCYELGSFVSPFLYFLHTFLFHLLNNYLM